MALSGPMVFCAAKAIHAYDDSKFDARLRVSWDKLGTTQIEYWNRAHAALTALEADGYTITLSALSPSPSEGK